MFTSCGSKKSCVRYAKDHIKKSHNTNFRILEAVLEEPGNFGLVGGFLLDGHGCNPQETNMYTHWQTIRLRPRACLRLKVSDSRAVKVCNTSDP